MVVELPGRSGLLQESVLEHRDPVTHALEPVYSVHYNDYAARLQGAQCAYDVGVQRTCWQVHSLTNWMGDDGVIKRIRMEARRFNLQGDTTFINGKVVKKYIKDKCPLIDIEMTGINQSGTLTSPGFATVMLPAKDINTKIPLDGTVCELDLPPIR